MQSVHHRRHISLSLRAAAATALLLVALAALAPTAGTAAPDTFASRAAVPDLG